MKYLIIQLCDSVVSYCHYRTRNTPHLISLSALEDGLLWAIKRNITIHIIYPEYALPEQYVKLLNDYPHIKITSEKGSDGDVIVLQNWGLFNKSEKTYPAPVVLTASYKDFIVQYNLIKENIYRFSRINIIFTDVHSFKDEDVQEYEKALQSLSDTIFELYRNGNNVQLNLITDRMMLSDMNNCNAGIDSIALSPDGNFYLCPAFYCDNADSVGNPTDGLHIDNVHLLQLAYAPICRICDAYNCKRCVWLNKKLTLEINTPSHQQCLMAHIERKIAGKLLDRIREYGAFVANVQIPELDYNDPFEKIIGKI
ncbi:MAG: CXXX repeat peptide maturase [Clostridium sp.]|nr:CXXX repeat peptide maturase [Clostridium sp.]